MIQYLVLYTYIVTLYCIYCYCRHCHGGLKKTTLVDPPSLPKLEKQAEDEVLLCCDLVIK